MDHCHRKEEQAGSQQGTAWLRDGQREADNGHCRWQEHEQEIEDEKLPTDPYFPLQWYLRNTGQNGGKVRLDLNVQAAWEQGITGKNVTTAIMDDGK